MSIDWLTAQLPEAGEVITVTIDASRDSESGGEAVAARWSALRSQSASDGVEAGVLDAVAEALTRPTGAAGPHGRVLVAGRDGVLVDRVLAAPPAADSLVRGVDAFALARVADETVRYLLVEIDRTGADIAYQNTIAVEVLAPERIETVEGDHDVLTKIRRAGFSTRRIQARAEDSWERNAGQVAAEIDRLVTELSPELLLVTGDVRAVALFADALGATARERLIHVEGGSRSEGVNASAFAERVGSALGVYRIRRREAVVDRLSEELGRDGAGAAGLEALLEALRKGQVADLVVTEQAAAREGLAERTLWVGESPLEVAIAQAELESLGGGPGRQERADLALGRAALAQSSGITIVDQEALGIADGVAAVLRWSDPSTPAANAPSSSDDASRR